jgi:uncharacterized protein (DUF433 family)
MESTFKQHIELRPSPNHGTKACIAGSRIRVLDVYVWHVLRGMSAHEICDQFPQLTMADVYAAMAYYWDHREEIEGQLQRAREIEEEFRKQTPAAPIPVIPSTLTPNANQVSS